MNDSTRADIGSRLAQLQALLSARKRIEEFGRLVVDAKTDQAAIEAVSLMLNCDQASAAYLLSTPLRHFRNPSNEALEAEIRGLESSLQSPGST